METKRQSHNRNQTNSAVLVDTNSGILSFSANDDHVNWARTLRLAQQAHQSGVRRAIIAVSLTQMYPMLRRMPQLLGLMRQHRISIDLAPAVELTLSECLFEEAIHVSVVNGGLHRRYVFLRLPQVALPIVPVVQSFRHMKLTPILVAPERVPRYVANSNELAECVESGALIQMSASSLLDQTDRRRVRFCKHLIRKNLCHVVASESGRYHDLPISLSDAYVKIRRWVGQERADALCTKNASCVFSGEPIEPITNPHGILHAFSGGRQVKTRRYRAAG